ncbi:MAG: methyltransferase domain-containing protein [Rhodospirillales bacterium]|nr:methyltransferase domain-containing protein [Rhodospirillales bacterium]
MPPDTETPAAAWDPAQYLRFADARLRPALDLLAQVPLAAPARVADLGCGPGTVTRLLRQRYPAAEVTGIDSSAAMLAKARETAPGCRFLACGFAEWRPEAPPDLIFSNAALHWTGGHEVLLPRLFDLLAPGGVLAVQMPAMHDAPLRRLQQEVAASGPWAARLADVADTARAILDPGAYWDILRPRAAGLDIWETIYLHPLAGPDPVVAWAEGSSLRPFLAALAPEQRDGFRAAYAEALRPHYPPRPDGTTLLPFRRLFLIASR